MRTSKTKKAKPRAKSPAPGQVLWDEKKNPSRGPRPTLTAGQIARIAVRVADANGLAAVSMQRIARECNVTAMALYRYVSSKDELLELMIDAAGGPAPDFKGRPDRWRSELKEWTRQCASIYRDHPWFLQASLSRRRIMGPNELGWLNSALGLLKETGLAPRGQHQAFLLLIGHVRSNAEFMAAGSQGLSARQWSITMTRLLRNHQHSYPFLIAALNSGLFRSSPDAGLDFGLECILDGVASQARKQNR